MIDDWIRRIGEFQGSFQATSRPEKNHHYSALISHPAKASLKLTYMFRMSTFLTYGPGRRILSTKMVLGIPYCCFFLIKASQL